MSPTVHTVAGREAPGTPEAKDVAQAKDDGQYGDVDEVKMPPKPKDPQEKLLDLLTDLAERMERLEASQQRQEDKERFSGREPSVFESAIGLGRAMDRQALDQTPPPRNQPVSPATYFGLKQLVYGYENAAANVEMAHTPLPALPQHYVPLRQHQQPVQPPVMQQGMHVPVNNFPRVLDTRQRKLGIRHFDGKELYQGLGSGFLSWVKRFVLQIQFAERASGFQWTEEVKVDVLGHRLTGMAERYYNQQVEGWWGEEPTLEHAIPRLLHTFARKITPAQSMKMFTAPKNSKRSWTEHYLYLVAVSEACGGADNLVLDNIVHYADPAMRVSMLSRLNLGRTDYLRQAEELAHFTQSTEIELRSKHLGRDVVSDVHEGRADSRKCFKCGKVGHLKASCPDGRREGSRRGDADFGLVVDSSTNDKGVWILDTGSGRHLVNDESLLEDAEDFDSECVAANGGALKITKRGNVLLETTAMGKWTNVRLLDVQYAEKLERNIISYGRLEKKGYRIEYRGPNRVIAAMSGGPVVFDVERCDNVLVVRTGGHSSGKSARDVLMAVLAESQEEVGPDVQTGTLMHFYRRLRHLNYDTILRTARDPVSGISLTDEKRANCLTCAQGKQTKNKQSRKDTGANSPTDVVGGVICSDLKGPMTLRDRLGNRYMVNFIDHCANYCRIFLAKNKDVAAQNFKHFMAFFERQFNCRVHVLRTDGGGEYKTLDLFCKDTGIARQVSEPRNQASNGKAERMHRTVMNMVLSMVFACGLPLRFFGGDAAEYAAYILNRSPSKGNPGLKSPLQMLMKSTPVLSDIVVFGSPCTVHRDAKNKSLGERWKPGMIIGKSDEMKGYRVYIPKDKVVVVTQHVKNVETLMDVQNEQLRRVHLEDSDKSKEEEAASETQGSAAARKSKSKHRAKSRWTREKHQTRSATRKAAAAAEETNNGDGQEAATPDVVNSVREPDPKNYGQAMKSELKNKRTLAMVEELSVLEENGVWTVVVPPMGSHVLHTKWVFKTKTDADGAIERFKARLVAYGNEQLFGINYGLTFAAVMELSTVKVILVFARCWGVPARHGDIPNAYVKAEKEQHLEIYLAIPRGMVIPEKVLQALSVSGSTKLALRLKKSLYGLKQAGRLWSKLLHAKLEELGFTRCVAGMCLYYKRQGSEMTLVGVYVDDLLVTASLVEEFFAEMSTLSVKDLGEVRKFLGMRVEMEEQGNYNLDQQAAIEELLEQHGLADANGVRAPIGEESNEVEPQELELLPRIADNRRSEDSSRLWVACSGSRGARGPTSASPYTRRRDAHTSRR